MNPSFTNLLKTTRIYRSEEVLSFINDSGVRDIKAYEGGHKERYINVPAAFDIETSSFRDPEGKKAACMYVWQFGLNGLVLIGRTWAEYVAFIMTLSQELGLDQNRRLIVYVHNLEFEFQWIRKLFKWNKVFATGPRAPVYAQDINGIEYRCSYQLSGYSLANVGRGLLTYKVEKAVGDLDYSLIRTSETPLTETELGYCVNDVKVVMAYVQEKIEQDGRISKIPLTKTAYVRNLCRNACLYPDSDHKKHTWQTLQYQDFIGRLQLIPDEYKANKRAFQGGFTHGNARKVRKTWSGVASQDETSAYPAAAIRYKYPMSSGEEIKVSTMSELRYNLVHYCCIFDIEFHNIIEREDVFEHPISCSKCFKLSPDHTEDNGRLVAAEFIRTTITDVDFRIYEKFYTWDSIAIGTFYRYRRGRLPKPFVLTILNLYKKKTELKGVEGFEQEYSLSKENINACYGSIVTDIVREEQLYTDDWEDPIEPDLEKALDKYNKDKRRYMFYPWGIFITAYNRLALFSAIYELGSDYIYSDTDSVKYLNPDAHEAFFRAYNDELRRDMYKAMDYYKLPHELVEPSTIKGDIKLLGAWDFEKIYNRFKTLGAKRYMAETNGKLSITVSGVSKVAAVPYIQSLGGDPFKLFDDDLVIPPGSAGKLTHTYIDYPISGTVTDYLGRSSSYSELTAIHLEPAGYELSLSARYIDYLLGIRERSK